VKYFTLFYFNFSCFLLKFSTSVVFWELGFENPINKNQYLSNGINEWINKSKFSVKILDIWILVILRLVQKVVKPALVQMVVKPALVQGIWSLNFISSSSTFIFLYLSSQTLVFPLLFGLKAIVIPIFYITTPHIVLKADHTKGSKYRNLIFSHMFPNLSPFSISPRFKTLNNKAWPPHYFAW